MDVKLKAYDVTYTLMVSDNEADHIDTKTSLLLFTLCRL